MMASSFDSFSASSGRPPFVNCSIDSFRCFTSVSLSWIAALIMRSVLSRSSSFAFMAVTMSFWIASLRLIVSSSRTKHSRPSNSANHACGNAQDGVNLRGSRDTGQVTLPVAGSVELLASICGIRFWCAANSISATCTAGKSVCGGLNLRSGRGGAGAAQLLPVKDDVGEKKRKAEAAPDNGFVRAAAQVFPSGNAADHAHLEKDDSNCVAAGHPLAVLLDISPKNERHGDGRGGRPQNGVHRSGDAEGACFAHAFFEVLNVGPEGSGEEGAGNVEAPHHTMQLRKALAQAIGELHGAKDESAGASEPMRQQIPLERLIVLPDRIAAVKKKAFVVAQHVGEHQADERENEVFRAQPECAGRHSSAARHRVTSATGGTNAVHYKRQEIIWPTKCARGKP